MTRSSIGAHGAIGNGRSVALVAQSGSIDWLCWPRFESPAVFAALLDERGGSWSIAPLGDAVTSHRYVDDTNVLETRFATAAGVLVVTDSMTVASEDDKASAPMPEHELLRVVRCVEGSIEVHVRYEPRPDFGRTRARLVDAGVFGIRCEHGAQLYVLRGERPLTVTGAGAEARFTMMAGDRVCFSLTFDTEGPAVFPPLGDHAIRREARSIAWWRTWIARMAYAGDHRDLVARSMLAVKLLSFAPSGAIVAAPTTSLPERICGDMNWDYRYCWLRDASMTAQAALALGFPEEATSFCSWLLHTTRLTRPELRILYDVYGNLPRDEEVLPLDGYRGSQPVRIRNAAAEQLQLDCYGEVIDAVHRTLGDGPVDRETTTMLADFGRFVCEHWREPDQGIWEERGGPQHHTFSKVLCWVALDRLIDLGTRIGAQVPFGELAAHREAIRADVIARGFDPKLGSYTTSYGDGTVDASLLLLPWYGFEPASSPRMLGTWRVVEERLGAGPGLFFRNERSRPRGEGAFGICSFWAVGFLARAGRVAEARRVFEAALTHANHLGLFGEEVDPAMGEALGNFPQAYTHIGIIDAALTLTAACREEVAA